MQTSNADFWEASGGINKHLEEASERHLEAPRRHVEASGRHLDASGDIWEASGNIKRYLEASW